jgi:hypothetical protein
LFLNNGDTILVTLKDTGSGLRADVNDLTTAGTGFMVASGANGFQHNADQNPANCKVFANFDYHPEYMTAAPNNYTAWAGLHPNVSFDHEIGHWELCTDSGCSTNPDPMEQASAGACTTVRGIGGCTDSDKDHDGTSYAADYADGTAAHPAPVIITSPTNNGVGPQSTNTVNGSTYTQSYKTITFKTTEGTNGTFYPFYSQAGTGAPCVFNFGNDIPGTTTNDFSKAAQYGTTITNPCIPAAASTPTITKSFSPTQIPINSTSTLAFTITNTDATVTLTGVGFSDTLPAGVVVASPNGLTGSCGGGTISAVANGNFISLSGATLAPSASCTFSVTVKGIIPGNWPNTTSALISDEAADGTAATAVLQVFLPPSISKAFVPNKVVPGGTTTLSFSITNPNSFGALTGVAFTDTLPAGVVVVTPNGLTSTCGGVAAAVAGGGTVSLSGGTIAASGSCTVSVNVMAVTEGIFVNSVSVTSTNGGPGNTASATLFAATPPNLSKAFGELSILPGGTTSLTFKLTNPNHIVTLTGLAFTDTLPAGLVLATPNGLTGSCDGGVITAVAGTNVITLVNATLAPQASCTFSVNVTSTGAVLGYVTNTTSTVTSNEALPGAPASATVFIGDPFHISYSSNLSFADSAVNISNTGANASALNPVTQALNGNLCVNVYTFSPDEQMVACCSCHVTPNALWWLSARSDLVSNTLTPSAPTSVVIKLVATLAGPGGGSGPGSTTGPTCNPATVVPLGPAGTANSLALGLTAWSITTHGLGPSAVLPPGGTIPPAGTALALTEIESTRGTLSAAELTRLTTLCGFLQANGSGFGICKSCRFGGLGPVQQ